MVENLSQAGATQARVAERGSLSLDLRPVTEFCKRAIAGRYPFVASSKRDVLPEDFGQMFGPGGLIDEFFQKRLAALVDTSTRPWRYKPVAEQGAITAQAHRAVRARRAHQGDLLPRRRPHARRCGWTSSRWRWMRASPSSSSTSTASW